MTGDLQAARLVEQLGSRGQTVAVAESLTGGLLAAAVTAVPGSSAVFAAGVVAYTPQMKTALLGIPASLIEAAGVVSEPVAQAMATGVRDRCGSDWGLGTTGVAGPQSHGGRPPGEVWLGLAGPEGLVSSFQLRLDGDRESIRADSVTAVLRLLESAVTGDAH